MEVESQIRIQLLMPYLEKGGVYPLGRWVLLKVRVGVRGRARGKIGRVRRRSSPRIGLEPVEMLPLTIREGWRINMGDMSVLNFSGLDDICIHLRAYFPSLKSNWVVFESVLAPQLRAELSLSMETRMMLSYQFR
jgi:hypothetical protein